MADVAFVPLLWFFRKFLALKFGFVRFVQKSGSIFYAFTAAKCPRKWYNPDCHMLEYRTEAFLMEQLSQILNELSPQLIDFACRLVGTKSLTCQEQDVAALVQAEMQQLGYDEVTVDAMGNVLGRIGSGEAALLFDSHMDTVTVNDEAEWSFPAYGGELRDGNICGRGAADMKCGLAASVYGAVAAKRAGLIAPGTAVYVSASSMEEDYDGDALKYLLQQTGLRPKGVVLCEPTSLRIAVGHRGRSLIEIKMPGVSCHASTPEKGKNPVYLMQQIIARVQALHESLCAQPGEHGSVALTNTYCTTASNNSVPQDATIILDRRLALGESEQIIGKEMDALVAGTDAQWCFSDIPARSWQGTPFVFHSFLPAWELPADSPLARGAVEACAQSGVQEPEVFKLGCSTNGVTSAGVFHLPSIVLGPGDLAYAHARNEFCPADELVRACAIYARLCGKAL